MHQVSVLVLSLLYLCLGDLVVNQFGPVLVEDFYADSYDHSGSTPAYTLTAADDFTVPTTYSMTINSVQFSGHFVAGTYSDKNVRNWTVLIYGDTISTTFPGYHVPNTANLIASQVQIATNVTFPNITVNVSFTSPPTLQSGQYWIGLYASMQGAALTYYFNVDRLQTSTPYGERFVSKETVANYYSSAYTNKWIPYNESSLFQPGEFGTGGYNLAFNIYGTLNDITPPSVSTFIFSPTSFDFSSGKTMNFTLVASDNDGVKAVKMSLQSPNKVSAVSFKLDTGNNWIYNTNFSFDPTAGSWSVIEIDVVDYAGNWKNYTSAQIQSLFGPYNSFLVSNSLATTSTSTSSTTTSSSTTTTTSSTSMFSTSTTSISATTSDATTSSSSISTSSSSSTTSGGGATTGGITSTISDMSTTTISSSTSASVNSSDVNNIKSTSSSSSNIIPIIGGAVGGFIALVAIALVLFFVLRRKRNNKTTKQEPAHNEVAMGNYNNFNSSSSSVGSLYMPMSSSTSTSTNVSRTPSRANLDTSIVITYTELKIENEVGSGAFGVVFRGRWRGGAVAIKQISGRLTPKQLSDFKAEASIMKNLRPHVNVVQFLGVTLHPDPLCLVTEFLDQGSLYSFMRRNKLDTKMLMNIVRGIASGMLHLHSEGLIHRDLASRNILLGSGQQVKISDFGMSRANSEEQNQTKSETGPLKWMAPESIRDRVYSTATDVWSFGVTVWEIVTVEDPFPNLDSVQAALGIVHNKLRLKIPDNCPFVLSKVMNLCFKTDPAQRPSFDVILSTLQNAAIEEWSFT